MKDISRRFRRSIFLMVLFLTGVSDLSFAQSERSVTIQDGKVYVDGQLVPPQQLPASMRVDGIEMHLSFSDGIHPLIPLNGRYYRFDGTRLVEAEGPEMEENGVTVFFRDEAPNFDLTIPGARLPQAFVTGQPVSVGITQSFKAFEEPVSLLQEEVQKLQQLSTQINRQNDREVAKVLEQVNDQVLQVTRIAKQLPQVEVNQYLNAVQEHDRGLYRQLLREHELERQTYVLASQIRGLTDMGQRSRKMAELRNSLDAIFELRQKNTRNEIDLLETQLQELRRVHEMRQQQKASIINRRIQELIDQAPGNDR